MRTEGVVCDISDGGEARLLEIIEKMKKKKERNHRASEMKGPSC